MNNPFAIQMQKLKTDNLSTQNNESVNTKNDSPLFNRRKKDNKNRGFRSKKDRCKNYSSYQ